MQILSLSRGVIISERSNLHGCYLRLLGLVIMFYFYSTAPPPLSCSQCDSPPRCTRKGQLERFFGGGDALII